MSPSLTLPDVIHRAELALDDRPHGIDLTGDILHAAVTRPGVVDVWFFARRNPAVEHMRRSFQAVITGQPLPIWLGRHHATAISPDGMLVWHVLENHCTHQSAIDVREVQDLPDRVPGVCRDCRARLVGDGSGDWTPR